MSTKNYKLGLFWGGVGVVGDYFGLGYLGDAGEGVFVVKCGPRNYKTGVMLGRRWFWTGILGCGHQTL